MVARIVVEYAVLVHVLVHGLVLCMVGLGFAGLCICALMASCDKSFAPAQTTSCFGLRCSMLHLL